MFPSIDSVNILFLLLLIIFSTENCQCSSIDKCKEVSFIERGKSWFFEVGRLFNNFNAIANILWRSPIFLNHRTAKFSDIVHGLDIESAQGNWSYNDSISNSNVNRTLDHVRYGRMVQSVYHLSETSSISERYGESTYYSIHNNSKENDKKTKEFLDGIFDGYKVLDILRTTSDTPNQLRSTTGKFLTELTARNRNLKYERCKGNFMGFIAYNKEKHDLAIIFRGTSLDREWIQNIVGFGAEWNDTDVNGEIKCGCESKETTYKMCQFSMADNELSCTSIPYVLIPGFMGIFSIISTLPWSKWSASLYTIFIRRWQSVQPVVLQFLEGNIPEKLKYTGNKFIFPYLTDNWMSTRTARRSIISFFQKQTSNALNLIVDHRLLEFVRNALTKAIPILKATADSIRWLSRLEFFPLLGHMITAISNIVSATFGFIGFIVPAAGFKEVIVSIVKAVTYSITFGIFVDLIFFFTVRTTSMVITKLMNSAKKPVFRVGFSELYSTQAEIPWETSPKKAVFLAISKYKLNLTTITIAGHSLGAALAVIAAHHAASSLKFLNESSNNSISAVNIRLITFACPNVASPEVFKRFSASNITHFHYLNRGDIVPIIKTGIFTNGLGIPNNHVLRLDPVSLPNDETVDYGRRSNGPGATALNKVRLAIGGFMSSFLLPLIKLPISALSFAFHFFTLSIPHIFNPPNDPPVQGVIHKSKLKQVNIYFCRAIGWDKIIIA